MATPKRNDIHRPSAINPEDYTFVSMEYIKVEGIGDCMYLMACRERIAAHMARTGGTYARHEHGGNCMVCGAHALYTALFYHAATNSYVRTGQECASKMDCGDWAAFRKAVRDAREAQAGKRKAQATLADAGLSACWDIYTTPLPSAPFPPSGDYNPYDTAWRTYAQESSAYARATKEESTIADIVGKLVKYGSISDAASKYLGTLLSRIAERHVRAARRAAESAIAADCPTGRIEVEGVILSTREDESDFGTVTKMLVKHDTGYKVWGTRPVTRGEGDAWPVAEVGDRVSFRATVTRSDRDPKFGFFSRPTNGRVVQAKQTTSTAPVHAPVVEAPEGVLV